MVKYNERKYMHIPEFMPELRMGNGETPEEGGCVMQVTHFLWDGGWSDEPPCVDHNLMLLAIHINDSVEPLPRRMLMRAIPDLMGTAYMRTTDEVHAALVDYASGAFPYIDDATDILLQSQEKNVGIPCRCDKCRDRSQKFRVHPDRTMHLLDALPQSISFAYSAGELGDQDDGTWESTTIHNEIALVSWFIDYVAAWRAAHLDTSPRFVVSDEDWVKVAKAMGAEVPA